MDLQPKDLLGKPLTSEYVPQGFNSLFYYTRNRPAFTPATVSEMLADPRILFGLWLIKGPIQDKAKFEVECDNQEVADFCQRQIDRLWRNSLPIALKCLDWGYSGSEVLYTVKQKPAVQPNPFQQPGQPGGANDPSANQQPPFAMAFPPKEKAKGKQPSQPSSNYQPTDSSSNYQSNEQPAPEYDPNDPNPLQSQPELLVEFDRLKDIHSLDIKAITHRGEVAGMYVTRSSFQEGRHSQNLYIGGPKKFWTVHWRERHPWYGLSRLFGCHIPWWEKWSDGGYRDIRRLWFHKQAFDGGEFYFPMGGSMRDENGNIVSFQVLARELMEKKRTGGILFLPNTSDGEGHRQWELIPGKPNPVPAGLLEYGQLIDKEILEGLGVPTEIIESSGEQGFGASSGRQVPETAFYAILQGLVNPLIDDFKKQVLEPLVKLNFGDGIDFDVVPIPMTASTEPADPFANAPIDPETGEPMMPGFQDEEEDGGDDTSEDKEPPKKQQKKRKARQSSK